MKTKGALARAINRTVLWQLITATDETINRLAERHGLCKATLYRVLSTGRAYGRTVKKIAKAFNVEPETLWRSS